MRTGPQYKIARRLGARIFPKTQTAKFTISGTERRRQNKKSRSLITEYGRQLLEKQKIRFTYGLTEKQLRRYVLSARSETNPVAALVENLESRLDNIIFRFGLAPSRACARQIVSHGHILVNGRRVTIPSYHLKRGEKVTIRPASRTLGLFRTLDSRLKNYQLPPWVKFDPTSWTGELVARPSPTGGESLNLGVILEFYSRV